ncbi:MAG: tRNA lysidine(34) synthetase TilS [Alphaproteobacteria bacterium]|nr:tRNA lysidine(34) synthetase TilS [Alphaproteobacteria bacterium]
MAAIEASFAAAMAAFAPFEPSPHLAVALSGGADSTALALLLHDWAKSRGGRVTALTVDHGLRATAAAEAAAAGRWAGACGLDHEILPWIGAKPARAIQERARNVRHELLAAWCAAHGVLHLCLGHHADDQAETVAMRAARRSGPDGLAAMAALVERRDLRLLRPLLAVPRAQIEAWLVARGVRWVEDPANRDPRFMRSRLRAHGRAVGGTAPDPGAGAARQAADLAVSDVAAQACLFRPEGVVEIDAAILAATPAPTVRRLLQRVLLTCGGGRYAVREAALDAFQAWVATPAAQAARTLGGCVASRRGDRLTLRREIAAIPARTAIAPAGATTWDRRFLVRLVSATAAAADAIVPGDSAAGRGADTLPVLRCLDGSRRSVHVFSGRGSAALVSVPEIDVVLRPAYAVGRARFFGPPCADWQGLGGQDRGAGSGSRRLADRPPATSSTSWPCGPAMAGRRQASENSDAS